MNTKNYTSYNRNVNGSINYSVTYVNDRAVSCRWGWVTIGLNQGEASRKIINALDMSPRMRDELLRLVSGYEAGTRDALDEGSTR